MLSGFVCVLTAKPFRRTYFLSFFFLHFLPFLLFLEVLCLCVGHNIMLMM